MVTLLDASAAADETDETDAARRPARRRRLVPVVGAVLLALVAATAGWLVPRLLIQHSAPSYLGKDASVVAAAMNCTRYTKAATHDESVYRYHDQGTCLLDGTLVTITTFDGVSDGDAYASVMKAVIPLLHPTWVGATYAAGPGWVLADTLNLTSKPAETAVMRLRQGATYRIPSAK